MATPTEPSLLRAEVRAIFTDEMHLAVASDDTDLIGEALLDSVTFVDLLFRLEQRFGCQWNLEQLDLEQFRTVARIADELARHGARGGGT